MIFEFQSREGASPNVNQKEKDLVKKEESDLLIHLNSVTLTRGEGTWLLKHFTYRVVLWQNVLSRKTDALSSEASGIYDICYICRCSAFKMLWLHT